MNYMNDQFCKLILTPENQKAILEMKRDVDAFMPSFSDSPERVSRWGHHYFCDEDGGRLNFDLDSPKRHICQVCGQAYENDEYRDGVWVTMYRNRAVVLALVSAVVYRATGEARYKDYALQVIDFYTEHYLEFALHNKQNQFFDSYEDMRWGCGRMMPQGLNEAILSIRFIQTIEVLRPELDQEWIDNIHQKMFREMFRLLAPQATSIHNISCWALSAIGVMGLAMGDREMTDFAFKSRWNIRRQLQEGVTRDGFWCEGSIHYNFFLLEAVSYLFLFSSIYGYDFGAEGTKTLETMFVRAYQYAFNNLYLPNPNDGWPNLNLKTFSYVYHTAARVFGEDSPVGNITKLIERDSQPRTTLPLSEPYYCCERVCLEQLLFNIDFDYEKVRPVSQESYVYPASNFAMLRNDSWNVFVKYGLNGKTHAHPDIMTVEVMYKGHRITRDISNAGYESRLCNEWHRKTLAHNTVCWNGTDITSVSPGECVSFDPTSFVGKAENVYEGIDYRRSLRITDTSLTDEFQAGGRPGVYDYIYHLESDIPVSCDLPLQPADLGFKENGYQHVADARRVDTDERKIVFGVDVAGSGMKIELSLEDGQEVFLLKTKDNPVNRTRRSILVRTHGEGTKIHLEFMA